MSASDLHWTEYFSGYQGYLTAHTTFDVRALNVSAVGKVVGRTFEGYIKAGVARYTLRRLRPSRSSRARRYPLSSRP